MENQEMNMAEELQQLREQYSSLKEELNRRNTIDEKMILSSIRRDLRLISSKRYISLAACLIAIPLIIMVSLELDLRLPFIIASVVWMLFMHIGNWLRMRETAIDSLSSESVQSFVSEMKRRMNVQFRWIRINYALFALWVGCFIGELIHTGMDKEMLLPIIGGICIGAAIGLTLGFRIHNRIIGTYEGIILELEN